MTADINTPDDRDLDRLNELWDGLAVGRRIEFAAEYGEDDRSDAEAMRALDGADIARDPDPGFLRDLRRSLMDISLDSAQSGAAESVLTPAPRLQVVPRRRQLRAAGPRLFRRLSGGSMRIVEMAAVVALLLTMAGFAVGNDGIDQFRSWLSSSQSEKSETTDATMYLGNAAHTGEMPGPAPVGEIGLLWRAPNRSDAWAPDSSPVIVDGVLYIATRDDDRLAGTVTTKLVAIDLSSSRVRWESVLPGFLADGTNGSPIVADGMVYIGASLERWLGEAPATPEAGATPEGIAHMAGAVVALDASTGQEVWSYDDLARAGASAPVVANGLVLIVSEDGILHALDARTGALRWTATASDDPLFGFAASPAISGDSVYVAGSDGKLHALSIDDGTEFWTAPFEGNQPTMAAVADGSVYLAAYSNPNAYPLATPGADLPEEEQPEPIGNLYAFDAASGSLRWSVEPGGRLNYGPTVAGDTVLLTNAGDSGRDVVALSAADGQEKWRYATQDAVVVPAVWSGDTVFFGSTDGHYYALNLATGDLAWQVATGGFPISAAFVADGVIAFASTDGNLYTIAAATAGVGTPTAAAAMTDISELPPCTIAPRTNLLRGENGAVMPLAGTPAASVLPVRDPAGNRSPQNLLFEEVPAGTPASQEVIDAIQATLVDMTGCARPGLEDRLAAYYSDDFFRRRTFYATGQLGVPGGEANLPFGVPGSEAGGFDNATVLPDGRVATVFGYEFPTRDPADADGVTHYGWFVVWVESHGRWLIDEIAELSERPMPGG